VHVKALELQLFCLQPHMASQQTTSKFNQIKSV